MIYKSILVPYDKTEPAFAALAEAIRFCRESPDTELHIVTMIDVESEAERELNRKSLRSRGHGINMDELETLREEVLLDEVIQARTTLRERLGELSNFVTIETIPTGNVGEEIITYATDNACDIIVMGSRGKGLLHSLGSTSRYVMQYAPLPVLIVKTKKR